MLQGVTSLALVVVVVAEAAAGLEIGIAQVVHLATMHTVVSATGAKSPEREVVLGQVTGNAVTASS